MPAKGGTFRVVVPGAEEHTEPVLGRRQSDKEGASKSKHPSLQLKAIDLCKRELNYFGGANSIVGVWKPLQSLGGKKEHARYLFKAAGPWQIASFYKVTTCVLAPEQFLSRRQVNIRPPAKTVTQSNRD